MKKLILFTCSAVCLLLSTTSSSAAEPSIADQENKAYTGTWHPETVTIFVDNELHSYTYDPTIAKQYRIVLAENNYLQFAGPCNPIIGGSISITGTQIYINFSPAEILSFCNDGNLEHAFYIGVTNATRLVELNFNKLLLYAQDGTLVMLNRGSN